MAAKKKIVPAKKTKVLRKKKDSVFAEDVVVVNDSASLDTSVKSSLSAYATKKNVVILLLLLCFGYLLYLNRGLFVAAMVNNQPITRWSVISDLEKRSGKQSLDSMITEVLIAQEAKKNNVIVGQDEVDAEIKKIEESVTAQGQNLEQLLSFQGMKKEDLVKQVRIQKMVEKILGDKVTVSDDEVKKFVEENKESFAKEMSNEDKNNQAREQLKQQKLSSEFQTWVADLKVKANIRYFVNY